MHNLPIIMKVSVIAIVVVAGLASAKTIKIETGPGMYFKPDDIKADVGDMLEFEFLPVNHSVAAGDFDKPCQAPATDGFMSGYWPIMEGKAASLFRVRVNDTNPIWFYCTQPFHQHCSAGMVGVVNAPAGKSLDDYKKKSMEYTGAPGEPAGIFGGEIVKTDQNATSSPASSATPAPTSAPSNTVAQGPSGTSVAPLPSTQRASAGSLGVAIGSIMGGLGVAFIGIV